MRQVYGTGETRGDPCCPDFGLVCAKRLGASGRFCRRVSQKRAENFFKVAVVRWGVDRGIPARVVALRNTHVKPLAPGKGLLQEPFFLGARRPRGTKSR